MFLRVALAATLDKPALCDVYRMVSREDGFIAATECDRAMHGGMHVPVAPDSVLGQPVQQWLSERSVRIQEGLACWVGLYPSCRLSAIAGNSSGRRVSLHERCPSFARTSAGARPLPQVRSFRLGLLRKCPVPLGPCLVFPLAAHLCGAASVASRQPIRAYQY